jgi:hypothetical protein
MTGCCIQKSVSRGARITASTTDIAQSLPLILGPLPALVSSSARECVIIGAGDASAPGPGDDRRAGARLLQPRGRVPGRRGARRQENQGKRLHTGAQQILFSSHGGRGGVTVRESGDHQTRRDVPSCVARRDKAVEGWDPFQTSLMFALRNPRTMSPWGGEASRNAVASGRGC